MENAGSVGTVFRPAHLTTRERPLGRQPAHELAQGLRAGHGYPIAVLRQCEAEDGLRQTETEER